MATVTEVTVEEYLATSYDPDMEYVDGQVVERNVGEYFHRRLQALIVALLMGRERERRFRTFSELRVEVGQRRRYRIPDICIKRAAAPGHSGAAAAGSGDRDSVS